ncbi:NAD(P)H-binding protein [Streptomyces sp. NBC_00669]|uniref:NmrA family NAD(P)-binding protein n=1 Tax=Streptomyces sp. NBC_00669 TaxID=2976011 RepID=UPI002E364A7F|nr:NAD(P)H-binding protein [Streptomyces sp. NBC_00669]
MIVVTTPTGNIGRQVLGEVLARRTERGEQGEPVRVIARDPSRLAPDVRGRVEVVQGSMTDPEVLATAFAGADSVFWLVPPYTEGAEVAGYAVDFTRPACEAISARGVRRVVAVTGLGAPAAPHAPAASAVSAAPHAPAASAVSATPHAPAGPGLGSRALDALIESTGVAYRSLRMPAFMENLLQQLGPIRDQGVFFLPISGDRRIPTCATRDIAAVAAELLLDGSWDGQEGVPVLGAEDLSYRDMARVMSEVLGRPIRYQQVPGEAFKAQLTRQGMPGAWARSVVDLLAEVDAGCYDAEPRTARSTTPTTFRQWCEDVLKPAVAG